MSERLLWRVLGIDEVDVVGVVTRSSSPGNADFRSLEPIADSCMLPVLTVVGREQAAIESFLTDIEPDIVYCFGWSALLGRSLLELPPMGMIGFHPAALPENRGRHPIIWALALGLDRTASTFFLMDESADAGPIVSQEPVEILPSDHAGDLYERIAVVAERQVTEMTVALARGGTDPQPQDHSKANHWRKRGRDDGRIDWRMSPDAIYNLVRALADPYVGAYIEQGDRDVKVWRCERVAAGRPNDEPGKVLAVEDGMVVVRCYGGAVRLVQHELSPLPTPGEYL